MEAAVVSCPCVMRAVKYRVNNTLFLKVHSRFYILPHFSSLKGNHNTELLCVCGATPLTPADLKYLWPLLCMNQKWILSSLGLLSIKQCCWLVLLMHQTFYKTSYDKQPNKFKTCFCKAMRMIIGQYTTSTELAAVHCVVSSLPEKK